jgi:hypothetical protein
MQASGDIRNPAGQTAAFGRAIERAVGLCIREGAHEVTTGLLLRAILADADCEGSRAPASLNAPPQDDLIAPAPGGPRPRADVVMIGFSSHAQAAMDRAIDAAREQQRWTSTGHLCRGLIEADDELRARLAVTVEAVRAALDAIEHEQ